MNPSIKQFINLELFKKFKFLVFNWWGMHVFVIDKNQSVFSPTQKNNVQNKTIKSLIQTSVFEEHFFHSIQEGFKDSKSKDFVSTLWKQTGLDLWIIPLFSDHEKIESYIVATGFLKNNSLKKIEQALSYAGVQNKDIKSHLSELKILPESEYSHVKTFLSILAGESFALIKEKRKQKQTINKLKQGQNDTDMLGQSDAMQVINHILDKIKDYKKPILIRGEPGTGKKFFARMIHNHSGSLEKNFIIQPCASINQSFFKNIMNSKDEEQKTLVLTEIADLTQPMQTNLLKTLEYLSKSKEKNSPRIMVTSSKNLEGLVESNQFHKGLFYQLNVINVKMPSLRVRGEDIALLANHFLQQKAPLSNKEFSPQVIKLFYQYSWPENVRELKEEVERMLSLSDSSTSILTEDLMSIKLRQKGENFFQPSSFKLGSQSLKSFLRGIEKQVIINVLKKEKGNKSKAAQLLGVSRTSMIIKAKKYGLIDDAENF